MIKQVKGNQVFLDGEAFYKIQNYDCMDDFFMTITSSSDVRTVISPFFDTTLVTKYRTQKVQLAQLQ